MTRTAMRPCGVWLALALATAARAPAVGRRAPAAAAAAPQSDALPEPRKWLDEILELRRNGRLIEAERALAAFRKVYPDHPLPPALAPARQGRGERRSKVACGRADIPEHAGMRPNRAAAARAAERAKALSYVFSRFEQLKASGALPSPGGVALEILRLTQSDDATVAELSHVLRADPALAGRLVKFANSAQAGASRPTVAISDAVNLLGFAVVRQLCLGFSVLNVHRGGNCAAFDYPRFWSRSLATALAAQAFCIRVRVLAPEEGFTCGLLADIGSLALASLHPDRYAALLAAGHAASDLCAAERAAFGADHLEFGAALLEDWRLPKICVDAVFHSERPAQSGFEPSSRAQTLCDLVSLARLVGNYFVADMAARRRITPALLLRAARIGIDAEVLAQFCDSVGESWLRWGTVLQVETGTPPRLDAAMVADAGMPDADADADADAGTRSPLAATAAPAQIPPAAAPAQPDAGAASAGDVLPAAPVATTAAPDRGLAALLVSDDRESGPLLRDLLHARGCPVALHADPDTALAAAMTEQPELMVIDLAGDAARADRLCTALRATSLGRQIQLLVTLSPEQAAELCRAPVTSARAVAGSEAKAAADDYLCKPVESTGLELRLRAAERGIALRRAAREDHDDLRRLAAELAIANRRLQRTAVTDALTGLPNRRYAFERLEQEWAGASRSQRPISCMCIAIDGFRQFTARQGHRAADQALVQVAVRLRAVARGSDVVCRTGSDGFLVICLDTDRSAAIRSGERLRAAVEGDGGPGVERTSGRHGMTLSIGVAARDGSMHAPEVMLRLCDEALQLAQTEGGNRVRAALSSPSALRGDPQAATRPAAAR